MTEFAGTWYVLPTPFKADLSIDLESLQQLIDLALSWGVEGFLSMGVMGESTTLSDEERHSVVLATVKHIADRAPVIVGCSASAVSRATALTSHARDCGASGVMVAPPPLLRDIDVLPRFLGAVSSAVALPFVIQDEPVASGVYMPVSVILACASATHSRTVKLEDTPTSPKLSRLVAADDSLAIFGGLGGTNALSELRRGAVGTMTGFAFPEVLSTVRQLLLAGQSTGAALIFNRFLPLIVFEAQLGIGLSVRKEVLKRRGAIQTGVSRVASLPLDRTTLDELDEVLALTGAAASHSKLDLDAA